MKKVFILILGLIFVQMTSAQEWHGINSSLPTDYTTQLVSSSEKSIVVDFNINGFYSSEVQTPRGAAVVISTNHAASIVSAGEPDIPSLSIPAIIGDNALMNVKIIDAQYTDFINMEIAPSKGDFPRTINPDDVPYTYGAAYQQDAFFPASQVALNEPYILRDFRGQNIIVSPFSYNPMTKVLRVYHHLRIEMVKIGESAENVKVRRSNTVKIDPEIAIMYQDHFINYQASMAKYNVVEEAGDLLIICHDDFMTAMEPFVNWKKQIGRPTTIVSTSTTGTTTDAIKAYITTQYNSNSNLTHILLIGDAPQIPGKNLSSFGEWSGKSDLWYGQMEGSDYYNELFVGRFSAQTTAQVTNQVNKVLNYERDLDASATWLSTGTGVATTAGNGGHFGEDDWQHIDNIKADLLAYNYTEVHRDYPNAGSSSSTLSQHINAGVSIINYCNHGSEISWGVFNYSNSNVNALTNDNKLPFIISVACLNGKYDYYDGDCFAEAWMHATNNSTGTPTGAIGGMFSYISQPWVPPMYGQDEMIDILVESNTNNIKRTMGGVSLNGNMKILDVYGSAGQGTGTYNTWILYGDPTLTLRNMTPAAMGVTHNTSMNTTATSFTVNATSGNGALATLTRNNEIMGSATINNGTAQITFNAPGSTGQATLTVFGYNKITYTATVNITNGGAPDPLTASVSAAPTIIARGSSSDLSATPSGGSGSYTYNWTPAGGLNNATTQNPTASPTNTTTYTCTVSDGSATATGTATITVVVPPTNLTASVNGSNVNLSWTAATPVTGYKVYRNNTMIAQNVTATSYTDSNLTPGTYSYTVRTVYSNVESPNSNTASATINAPLSATASANPTVIAQGASSNLTASATGGSGSYSYYWSPSTGLNNTNIQSPVATPTATTTYTVTVTSGSNTATANTTVSVVTAPTNLTANADGTTIDLSWTAPTLANSYKIYRDGNVIASNITATNYSDEDMTEGEYCYTVSCVYSNVESPESAEACATIYGCPAPENLEAEYFWNEENFGTVVTWDKVESNNTLTEFRVYRSKDGNDYELISHLANIPFLERYQCSDMPLAVGTYYYKVTAYYNATTCESGFAHATANPEDDYVVVTVTSVEENPTGNVNIYPNPTNGIITVKANNIKQIIVTNISGQEVYNQSLEANEINLDLSFLGNGMYLVNVVTEEGLVVRKVMLND